MRVLRKLLNKLLAVDEEEHDWAREIVRNHIEVKRAENILEHLKRKHYVDAIYILDLQGNIVGSSEEDVEKALLGGAIYAYIVYELPDSKAIMVKEKNWYMIYRRGRYIYVIRAPSHLSLAEMYAIARDAEKVIGWPER